MKKLIGIVIVVFLFSCTKETGVDCTTVLPPPNWFEISIDNSAGDQLIYSVYVRDSFLLYNANSSQFLKPLAFAGDPSYLRVAFPDIESGVEYYLELDTLDTDTLVFNFSEKVTECYSSYSLHEIVYNGYLTPIEEETSRYHVVKH